ncbi:hypothetical protein JG688_00015948 [Phytophthora aleatoria]|uniref:Uncharacterized protein n=1 Tax=Phytophthora aleatoria TaxID=2496075 RepID=A0A8J5I4U5_9STRA|nr:hypothetical protein JG688_00015948 [Phytophthora aleatoria]
MFEKWFTNLRATLKKEYGPCKTHMNGASYHKRLTNPTPNKSWLKAEIQNWLTERSTLNLFLFFTIYLTFFLLLEIVWDKRYY